MAMVLVTLVRRQAGEAYRRRERRGPDVRRTYGVWQVKEGVRVRRTGGDDTDEDISRLRLAVSMTSSCPWFSARGGRREEGEVEGVRVWEDFFAFLSLVPF